MACLNHIWSQLYSASLPCGRRMRHSVFGVYWKGTNNFRCVECKQQKKGRRTASFVYLSMHWGPIIVLVGRAEWKVDGPWLASCVNWLKPKDIWRMWKPPLCYLGRLAASFDSAFHTNHRISVMQIRRIHQHRGLGDVFFSSFPLYLSLEIW